MVYLHYIATGLLFLIGSVVGWKIYIYLISATDAVQQSVVGHYFGKFINAIVVGVLFVLGYLWATGLMSDAWSYLNSDPASKKPSQSMTITQSSSSDSSTQSNPMSFICANASNQAQSVICNNPSLVKLDTANFKLFKMASEKNQSLALDIQQVATAERDSCGADEQCIYFSYEKSTGNYKQLLGI